MRIDPPINHAARYPLTAALGLGAIGMSIAWWTGQNIDWAFMAPSAFGREPWRLPLSALPHVNPIHLVFNALWLWELGTRIEQVFGPVRYLGLVLLLAVVSGASEFAVSVGGVGLSGVVYGFFGLMYVLRTREARFAEVLTTQVVQLFVAWFFVCIALTVTKMMPIGNVAHGSGAILGWVIGKACLSGGARRTRWSIAVFGMFIVSVALGTVGRPFLAGDDLDAEWMAYEGMRALAAGDHARAVDKLERAVRSDVAQAEWYDSLGITYQRCGRDGDALTAYRKAVQLDGARLERLSEAMASILNHQAHDAMTKANDSSAVPLLKESIDLHPGDAYPWKLLGAAYERTDDPDNALDAYRRAIEIAADDGEVLGALRRLQTAPEPQK